MSHITSVGFAAYYEESIKNTIFDAMDCSLMSNKRLGKETRWFSEYPEFTLIKAFPWDSKEWDMRTVINPSLRRDIELPVERINSLYNKIKGLFVSGTIMHRDRYEYPITIHQIFNLGENVWAMPDGQSVFFHKFKGLPTEYLEWAEMAKHHDYTYMMSDSSSTHRAGEAAEDRMTALRKSLDDKTCTLWYNYILGRMRTRPQDGSFGIHKNVSWNSLTGCYSHFNITPDCQDMSEFKAPCDPVNTPCLGFPQHPRRLGWMQGDYDIEDCYSNKKQWTKEEYEAHIEFVNLQNAMEYFIITALKDNPDKVVFPSKFNVLYEGKAIYQYSTFWGLEYSLTNFETDVWGLEKDIQYM